MPSAPRDTTVKFGHLANIRLANKTGWNLNDILEAAAFGRASLDKAMSIAERKMDTELIIHLARVRADLATIERKAGDALRGEYREQ
jgi:hypothetical protein